MELWRYKIHIWVFRKILPASFEIIFIIIERVFRIHVSIIVLWNWIGVRTSILVIEDHIGVSIYSLNSDTKAISTIGLASCAGRLRIAL